MKNASLKINLSRLKHASVVTLTGRSGKPTRCLVIPLVDNYLFEGAKGVYLDAQAWPLTNRPDGQKNTHLIKPAIPREIFDKMTDPEKREIPIIGSLTDWSQYESGTNYQTQPQASDYGMQPSDDLPF